MYEYSEKSTDAYLDGWMNGGNSRDLNGQIDRRAMVG